MKRNRKSRYWIASIVLGGALLQTAGCQKSDYSTTADAGAPGAAQQHASNTEPLPSKIVIRAPGSGSGPNAAGAPPPLPATYRSATAPAAH